MNVIEDEVRNLLNDTASEVDLSPMPVDAVIGDGRRALRRRRVVRGAGMAAAVIALGAGGVWGAAPFVSSQDAPRPGVTVTPTPRPTPPPAQVSYGPIEVAADPSTPANLPTLGPWLVRYGKTDGAIRLTFTDDTSSRTLDWFGVDLAKGTTMKWMDDHTLVSLLPAGAKAEVWAGADAGKSTFTTVELREIGAQLRVIRYETAHPAVPVTAVWQGTDGAVRSNDSALQLLPVTNSAGHLVTFWMTANGCGKFYADGWTRDGCDPRDAVDHGVVSNRWDDSSGMTTYLVDVTGHTTALRFAADSLKPSITVAPRALRTTAGHTWAVFEVLTSTVGNVSTVTWQGGSGTVL